MFRKVLNLSIVLVLLFAGLMPAQSAQAEEPQPAFHIVLDHGYVCTGNWAINAK